MKSFIFVFFIERYSNYKFGIKLSSGYDLGMTYVPVMFITNASMYKFKTQLDDLLCRMYHITLILLCTSTVPRKCHYKE
jgi:hypothetical protein